MNEYNLFKKLLDDDMVNFNAILMKYYKKLNLNEKELVVLSYLIRQETKGTRIFSPSKIKSSVGLTSNDIYDSLDSLTKKEYLDVLVEANPKTGKSCEFFYLDNLYKEVVNLYLGFAKKEDDKRIASFQEEISISFEELFLRQLSPLDAEIIRKWGEEKKFTLEEIKNEMANCAKVGKTSLKFVDQALIKNEVMKKQSPKYIEANAVIEELKNRWKK